MGVSILEGSYVKRMTVALENIDESIGKIKNSSSGPSVIDIDDAIKENIIVERNLLTNAIWSPVEGDNNRYVTGVLDAEPNANYAVWTLEHNYVGELTVYVIGYDNDGAIRFTLSRAFEEFNIRTIFTNLATATKIQISIGSDQEDVDLGEYFGDIFFARITMSSELSDLEKAYIRYKLNIGDSEVVDELAENAIRVTAQEFSDDQKAQARANIGLDNISDLVEGTVKYNEDQTETLTDDQKARARANIGLDNISDLVEGTVKYNEDQTETLTDDQKAQARANIGLDNISDLVEGTVKYNEKQELKPLEQDQARDNIAAAKASDVSALNSTVSSVQAAINSLKDNVSDITKIDGGIHVDYANGSDGRDIVITTGADLDSIVYDDQYYLHFYDKNQQELYDGPFFIQGGGGGGTAGGYASISRITPAELNCVYGQPTPISFEFAATDTTGDTVGAGSGTWSVNGVVVVRNETIAQGKNTFDIGNYLSAGTNTIRLSVSVDVGGESNYIVNKTWSINAVNMRFIWSYDETRVNTDAYLDSWTVYGDILKTTHTRIDGTIELDEIVTTKSNSTQSIEIPMQEHGAHSVERWVTAMIGETEQSTPVQYHEMIFAISGDPTPIIALGVRDVEMNQYDTYRIPIIIYDPASLTASATLSVDDVDVDTWTNRDRTIQYWNYTPSEAGTHFLKITCGASSRTLNIVVNEVEMDVEEVSGYAFRFKASDFASNEAVKNWESNGVTATYTNQNGGESAFDWINGGLHTETVNEHIVEFDPIRDAERYIQQYFCIKAGNRMTIDYEPFARDPKADGMTFKIIFKIKNCRDYDANIANCRAWVSHTSEPKKDSEGTILLDEDGNQIIEEKDHYVGFRMDAHKATYESSGTTIEVPYGEDEYVELEFDTYPISKTEGDGNVRYMMAWIDGVITTCRVYGSDDIFVQPETNRQKIVLGSDDCDLYIYMVKMYPRLNKGTNFDNHIANFIMDAPNASEMVRRYNRNDILNEGGDIDYLKLSKKNPDLRVWLYDIPYLTNAKDDKIKGCKFQQIWEAGDDYYQMEGTGTMSVQGTSSVNYIKGAANTDINFTELKDGNGKDLMADSTKDDTYGNNWYIQDEENPGHAKVFTVEEGDELGPECIAVERDSDRNITKYIKAVGMKLNDNSCPITYSNTKVNFASCEQVNNMCNAVWYQRYNPYPSLTPRDTMEFNMGVQFIKDSGTVPDGNHFVLFGDDSYHMYSIANMGTSKKNVHLFHDLSNPDEVCIEVNDNGADQMRMVSDDLSDEDWKGKKYYGMRYPDTKDPRQEIRDAWQRLVTWFATNNPNAATGEVLETPERYENYTFKGHDRAGLQVLRGTTITQYSGTYTTDTFERRIAKMLQECEDYMVMDSFVYHYVYLERHTMVDNVSKNNFWSSTDLKHWDLSKAYDMDTSDGNNNQGQLVFDYGLEWNDINPTDLKTVFNGGDSVWFVFVANLYEACQTMFINRETAGAWSAQGYLDYFKTEQQKVPERCWNQCYWYDYLRTYENNISDEWISFLDGGQKTHQRQHYETYQELYDSSKYVGSASASSTNNINLRAYTPNQWGGVVSAASGAIVRAKPETTASIILTVPKDQIIYITEKTNSLWRKVKYGNYEGYALISQIDALEPKKELTVTMYNKMYISISIGTTQLPPVKAERGIPYVISFEQMGTISNTVINVNTASMVQAISGFEYLYPDTCVFDNAIRLRELTIGSAAIGYVNNNLQRLSLSNNRMLERLYVQNQPNATSVLDLSNCPSLVYLDATGSGFTGYEFADGGLVETAILQAPTSLRMKNLANLTDDSFIILDHSRLLGIRIENMANLNTLDLVAKATALQIARLIDIYWRMQNVDTLTKLYKLQGYDETGIVTNRSVVTGYAHTPSIRQRNLDEFNSAWPNLEIDLENTIIVEEYPIRFYNWYSDELNNEPILDKNGNAYVQYVGRGEDAYDPVEAGEIDEPSRETDAQYIYTYTGWNNLPEKVISEGMAIATYSIEERLYKVSWYLDNTEMSLLRSTTVPYGSEVMYDPEDEFNYPTKTTEEDLYVYNVFDGWDKSTGYVKEDIKVHAKWIRANLPQQGAKKLKDMNVAEIYGVSKARLASEYWDPAAQDYTDIKMGYDFDFTNVKSEVLLENKYFDGTSLIRRSDIRLFDADAPSFTLAIDYEFSDITSDAVLCACYDQNGSEGFKLQYSYINESNQNIVVIWGDKTITVSHGTNRGIIAIRHRKGSTNLYIASDGNGERIYHNDYYDGNSENGVSSYRYDGYGTNVRIVESPRTQTTETNAILSFGGVALGTMGGRNYATGWIHWAKIWYDDLGNVATKQLAYWPHETWRMEYRGMNLYNMRNETGLMDGASFVSSSLLPQFYSYSPDDINWTDSKIREFLNTRCYQAMPINWKSILGKTLLQNRTASGTLVQSEDKIYTVSRADIVDVSEALYVSEGKKIPWFSDNTSRAKFAGLIIPENVSYYENLIDDPTLYTESYNVKEGDIWVRNYSNILIPYMYVSEDTVSKHYTIGGRNKDHAANIKATGSQKGMWIRAYGYMTRTPWSSNTNYLYSVNANGAITSAYISSSYAKRPPLIMFSI